MQPIRVGVVGLGQVAQIMHIPYLHTMPGFELAAVCDLSPKLVEGIANLYRVSGRYLDYHEMIAKAELDAVVICSTFEHADIALAAIERKLHVFAEKPLCESPALAREIAEAGDRVGVKVMVAVMKRYDPGYWRWQQEIKDLHQEVRLLRVHDFCHHNNKVIADAYELLVADDIPQDVTAAARAKVNARYREALGRDPAPHIVSGYGLALGLGVHDMTILRGSFGDPRAVLFADIASEGFPTTVAVLDYGNFRCTWEIGVTDTKQMDQELAAWTKDAIISLRFPSPYIRNIPTTLTVTRTSGEETVTATSVASYRESFQNELAHFRDCVLNDQRPMTDAWEGLRDIEWLLEISQKARGSASTGREGE
jgi:predicted dehydrogenase